MLLSYWLRSLNRRPLLPRRVRRRRMSRRRDLVMHSAGIAAAESLEDRCLLSSISISDVTVTEGNTGTTNANFTVSLSEANAQTVIVQFVTADGTATAGSDYQAMSGVVAFAPGQTSQTISIPVIGDTVDENNETFFVILFNPVNDVIADGTGIGTIIDNDPQPVLNISDASVVEGDAGTMADAFFTVTLSEPSPTDVTVNFATAGMTATQGTDFVGTSGTLTFEPGEVAKVISVRVIGDDLDEADETFRVTLSAPSNATIGDNQGIGTILDDDAQPTLSINDVTINEGDVGLSDATFTVTLSAPSGRAVTVDFATANGTATAGNDYVGTSGTVTIPAMQTSATITVPIIGDELDEPNETFTVSLSNPMNAGITDSSGTGTIVDNDPQPALSIGDVTVTEGDTGTLNANFVVTLSTFSGQTVTVNFATANGSAIAGDDYVATSGTLTFNPGETTKVISVPIIGDTIDEENETFTVTLSGAVNATIAANQGADPQATGTIIDNDAPPTLRISDETVTEGDSGTQDMVFEVTLSSPSSKPITVNFATRTGSTQGAQDATPGMDFAPTSGTLVFEPGQTTQTITVPILADLLDEPREEFFVDLSGAMNAGIVDGTGLGRIEDNDGGPGLVINDTFVVEPNTGSTNAVFTVTLLAPSAQTVTVNFATSSGTATAGLDFASTSGTLTFAPGDTIRTISVPVLGDTIDEVDEVFIVSLTNAMNASIDDGQGVGTILDNDAGPVINVIGDPSIVEGDAGTADVFFTVTLSSPSTMPITVNFATTGESATAGTDFVSQSGTLTFAPGETTKVIGVPVIGDTLDEANETFRVDLSAPTNATIGDGRGVATIIDNDGPPSLSINDVTLVEGNSGITNAIFTVTLSQASGQTVTVNFATADGTATAGADYTAVSGTLVFPAGTTTQMIVVPVFGDVIDEGMFERFTVNLSGATNANISDGSGTGQITDDDDPPAISISDTMVVEGNSGTTTALFTVMLSTFSALPVSVNFVTTGQTATAGVDFMAVSGTLTFVPGQSVMQIAVPVIGDTLAENNETFQVTLQPNPTNGTLADNIGVGTILNDDPDPSLSINNVSVTEGDTGVTNATFTVSLSAASSKTITVNFATADVTATAGMDYGATSGTLTFAPNETSKTITVPVLGDTVIEPNETFDVNLSGPTNASISDSSGRATIIDDDGPRLSISDVSVAEGNTGLTNATFTISLNEVAAQPVTVSFATANGTAVAGVDYLSTGGTVTFNPGETSKTVTVAIIGDNIVEPDETFFVNLSGATGATIADNQGVGTILNDDPVIPPPGEPSVSIGNASTAEGNSGTKNLVFTVSLSSASANTVTVSFATANGTATAGSDYTATSGSVVLGPFQTSATISVPILGDTVVEPNETFFVNLTGASNASIADGQAVGTIVNDDPQPPQQQTIERRVNQRSDDAEEEADGDVDLDSSDLEMVRENSLQTVGIRFTGLNIPAGSTIHNAFIQFTTNETDSEPTALKIEGQLIGNAPTFRDVDDNISSRARTSAEVNWNPAPWDQDGEAGPDQRTPNLASIIQEIVNQGGANGWQSGNALAIIITGTGKRVADAFDNDDGTGPLLHVEFTPPAPVGVQSFGAEDSSANDKPADLSQVSGSASGSTQVQSTGGDTSDDDQGAGGGQGSSGSGDLGTSPQSDAFGSILE